MSRLIRGAVAAALAAVAVLAASVTGPAAQADKMSFMDYLIAHGYTARYAGGSPVWPANTFLYGYMACSNFRDGYTLDQQLPRYWNLPEYPLVAEAAQHELCPETLPPGQPAPPEDPPAGDPPPA